MHVLHRPHLPNAAAITAACAVLAAVLVFLQAGTLSDAWSTSASVAPAPAPAPATAAATWTEPGWNLNPFARLLRAPVRAPWRAGA